MSIIDYVQDILGIHNNETSDIKKITEETNNENSVIKDFFEENDIENYYNNHNFTDGFTKDFDFMNGLNNTYQTNYAHDDKIILLKKYNIFYTQSEFLFHKWFFIKKIKGKFYFYISHFHDYFAYFLKLLEEINNKKEISDFDLICFNFKFRPKFNTNFFIDNKKFPLFKIFCPSEKPGFLDKAFIPYYLLNPKMIDKNCLEYKRYKFIDIYNEVIEKSKEPYQISKAVFRGSENNSIREKLFELNHDLLDIKKDDYINFINFLKYKYIIDMWGINGHCGRRYFYLFFNRVIFIPKEDENKQFFEVGDNGINSIKPNIHYVEYSVHNPEEIIDKIKFLEENPSEYDKIRDNCRNYALKYLNYDKVLEFLRNILES